MHRLLISLFLVFMNALCQGQDNFGSVLHADGVPAGSVCVSTGVGQPCAYQTKTNIDVRDFGVTSSGDQSSNLTSAWNAAGSTTGIVVPFNVGKMSLANSVSPNPMFAYSFEGSAGSGTI
jgi:hypothetical protein